MKDNIAAVRDLVANPNIDSKLKEFNTIPRTKEYNKLANIREKISEIIENIEEELEG